MIRYARHNHAFADTACTWNSRNSPSTTAVTVSNTPPANICAPELIPFAAGSGTFLLIADAIDQLTDANNKAMAPIGLIAESPNFTDGFTRTITPPTPNSEATTSRAVSRRLLMMNISESAMNTGIVAIITAAIPDGTRCSAQNNSP